MIKGIVRNVDQLGRITPPKEFRAVLGISELDKVDMYLDGKVLRICKAIKPYKGVVRRLDKLGRATPPSEFREYLKLRKGEAADIYLDGNDICICRASLQCVVCGNSEENLLANVDEVLICKDCCKKAYEKFKEV